MGSGAEGSVPDDATLVRRVADCGGGSDEAVSDLYERYASLLLGLARRILGSPKDAEDLVHDVFLEVWRHAADYDPARGSVRAWITTRLRSRALDRKKAPAQARAVSLDAGSVAEVAGGAEDPSLGHDRSLVREALAALPPDQRAVIELGYFEGLSSSEIAERLSTPIGTVKSRVAAAMVRLRGALLGDAPGSGGGR